MNTTKRSVSFDSRIDAFLDRRNPMKGNTIAVQNGLSFSAVSSLDVSRESGIQTSFIENGLSGSVNSLALSKCSDVYVGCYINNSSSNNCKPEIHNVSSPGSDFHTSTILHDGIEKKDLSSWTGCPFDQYLQNVIDNTHLVLKNWKMGLFERTPAYESSLHTLARYGTVFIIGNLGDGKTMTSRKLMDDMRNTSTILLEINARNPANFERLVNGKRNTVVFIDDFLGKEYLDKRLLKMWTSRFPLMEDMRQEGNIQFILTTRKDILEEAKSYLKILEFFCQERIVDMTTCDLSGVKEHILMRHVKASPIFVLKDDALKHVLTQPQERINITSEEIKEISKIETPIGYPLCCYLYTRKQIYAREGKLFFQNPVLYIMSEIERLEMEDKNKYCVLAVVLLCGGKIMHNDRSIKSHSEIFRSAMSKVSETCEIQLKEATIVRVANILASSGTFLRLNDGGAIIFSHDATKKAIALAYCTKGLKDIIELCPFGFLLEMVGTNSNDAINIKNSRVRSENSFKIELGIRDFDGLANRFVREILGGNVWEVSHHKAFLDSVFLNHFFAIMHESQNTMEVVTARYKFNFGGDLLFYAAVNEVPKVELLERLLKYHSEYQPRKGKHASWKINGFSVQRRHNIYLEQAMSSALHTACMLGRKEMFDVLLRFNARQAPGLLSAAMKSQHFEIIQSLLTKFKWSVEQKKSALLEACSHGNIELFNLIVQSVKSNRGENILSKCLLESAKSGSVELCGNILSKGCDVNYRGDLERCALHEACIGAHESLVCRLLRVPNIDINAIDKYGYTALDYASLYNLNNIAKRLTNAEAELNVSQKEECLIQFGI